MPIVEHAQLRVNIACLWDIPNISHGAVSLPLSILVKYTKDILISYCDKLKIRHAFPAQHGVALTDLAQV